jgi:hypothetical protein
MMTKRVINIFEMVKIKYNKGKALLYPKGSMDSLLESIQEKNPVREARK